MGLKPGDLIRQLRKGGKPAPGYLFLGAEPFYRERCRQTVRKAALGPQPDETAIEEIDLAEQRLTALVEAARTLSLFSSERVVIGRNAEQAVPKVGSEAARLDKRALADYFADPTPGTVVLIEAVKHDSRERGDREKLSRAAKFYGAVPVCVELEALSVEEARYVAKVLAGRMGIDLRPDVLAEMVDMLGADGFRIENELQKLSLYIGGSRPVTQEDLDLLLPEARQSGVFDFSQALAERDRTRALGLLDTMSQAGMYWPMQLNLIAALFRQALAAKELGLSGARDIGARLGAFGLRVWPARARQVDGIVSRFREEELRKGLVAVFEADRDLRSPRPDDRVVMEMLVMKLTSRPAGAPTREP